MVEPIQEEEGVMTIHNNRKSRLGRMLQAVKCAARTIEFYIGGTPRAVDAELKELGLHLTLTDKVRMYREVLRDPNARFQWIDMSVLPLRQRYGARRMRFALKDYYFTPDERITTALRRVVAAESM